MTAPSGTALWRWPLEPLLEARGPLPERPDPFSTAADTRPPDACEVLARRLRLEPSSVRRALVDGLTDAQADRWAVRAGWHPASIWGWDAWTAAGLDRHRVSHLLPEARRIAAEIAATGEPLRKADVIAALRASGVSLSRPRATTLWQRLRAVLADPNADEEVSAA